MIASVLVGAWLLLLWLALWNELSVANIASGTLFATLLLTVFPLRHPRTRKRLRPVALVRFVLYFAYKLVEANFVVAWEVATPGSRINLGIVEVPVRGADDVLLTSLGNAISLTPGTLTLEVRKDPPTLYVHVLHWRSVEDTRRDIWRLERFMLEALAPELATRMPATERGEGGS